ncbi:hypothetical protein [Algivirga pacifica]|uniref:YbbR-like protein n=1 Tax=Algivirga pacifica TaxID=1162670 RepID=A0ABP9D783_9BACT
MSEQEENQSTPEEQESKSIVQELHEKYISENDLIKTIRDWDWRALTICVMISFTFWIFNALNNDHTADLKVPLSVAHEQTSVVSLSPPPDHLTVNVSGNGWTLLTKTIGLGNDGLNLTMEDPVQTNFVTAKTLLPEVSNLLRGLKVNYMLEDSLFFDYDELVSKKIAMEVQKKDIPLGEGYEVVSEVSISPDTVTLTGPRSYIKSLPSSWALNLFEFEPIEQRFDENIEIDLHNNRYTSVDYAEVNITFDVSYILEEVVPAKLLYYNFSNEVYPILPEEGVKVQYEIKEFDVIEDIDSIKVAVSYDNINWNDSTVVLKVVEEHNFLRVNVTPNVLNLKFKE